MGFKKRELLEEIKSKRIDFPSGKFLLIDYRARVMPYSKKKLLMDSVLNIQASAKRMKRVQKELENKSLSEVERERYQDEVTGIMQQVNEMNAPLVDYLGGTARRPSAIAKWDLTDDNDEPLPITREEIEDLDSETLTFIAWELLNTSEVSEESGARSQPSSPLPQEIPGGQETGAPA